MNVFWQNDAQYKNIQQNITQESVFPQNADKNKKTQMDETLQNSMILWLFITDMKQMSFFSKKFIHVKQITNISIQNKRL
jgi:hypothetical protein